MKFSASTLWALLFAVSTLAAPTLNEEEPVSYDGTKVVRIQLDDSKAQAQKVAALIDGLKLETWTHGVTPGHRVDIQISPDKFAAFEEGLGDIAYRTMHEDLGESIRAESQPAEGASLSASDVSIAAVDLSWFNSYHSYADHLSYLSQLVAQFPGRAKIVTAGTSYQGRPITGIHIYGSSGGGTKPAVIFHGTVHAREWITTMVNEFIAYQLLSNYASSTEIRGYVDKYDYYIFPVVNPDGFVFSQTNTRLWRKNRMPAPGSTCIGTDINRNWDAGWALTGGASTSPCSETYKGNAVGSSPEFKGLSAFQNARKAAQGVKFYLDFHSYSQLWMTPYGYSCTKLPPDHAELQSLSSGAVAAVQAVYGTVFEYGPICTTIYKATGGSVDYGYDVTGIKYSYTAELRDTGDFGFVLPANQIYPSGVETWAGIKYMLANIN